MAGLTDMQRLAIAHGNGDYADEIVCPDCRGEGRLWSGEYTDRAGNLRAGRMIDCPSCDSSGHVPSPAIINHCK